MAPDPQAPEPHHGPGNGPAESSGEGVRPARIIVVMGVSGSGKSTVGLLVAKRLGAAFLDGDGYHLPENKEKMRAGVPLTDDDRWQWLATLGREARARRDSKDGFVVLACSALKRVYREFIATAAGEGVLFLFLDGTEDVIGDRMARRRHEFMNNALLSSQFATLERPGADENVVLLPIAKPPAEIADEAVRAILLRNPYGMR